MRSKVLATHDTDLHASLGPRAPRIVVQQNIQEMCQLQDLRPLRVGEKDLASNLGVPGQGRMMQLSIQKFSSNVVEKLFCPSLSKMSWVKARTMLGSLVGGMAKGVEGLSKSSSMCYNQLKQLPRLSTCRLP